MPEISDDLRVTIVALNLNNLIAVTVRRNWITAGWHPPQD
jgi:hypothetical protein